MISLDVYLNLVRDVLSRDLSQNNAQLAGVTHSGDEVVMLVAGPGSGKTTVLVLRALRHVFVDGVLPENLLITTFTRKAARELRTRWLDWGTSLLTALAHIDSISEQVERVDLNRCRIDTLDSVSQQALTENRIPGEIAPILADASASRLMFKRSAFTDAYNTHQTALDNLLSRYSFDGSSPRNRGEALKLAKTLSERLIQDRVDFDGIGQANAAIGHVVGMTRRYQQCLDETNIFDFSALELKLLERIRDSSLSDWCESVHALLIDEYQDTNPLQEEIYFELISTSSPLVTIVGDDDQAMYRFRGGSVELFTEFRSRCQAATGFQTQRIDMIENYRSSSEIIKFYNSHILCDPGFSSARINPNKPEVTPKRGELNMPVLGLFRPDAASLACSLSTWLDALITDRRIDVRDGRNTYELTLKDEGNFGDCVLLAHSVAELNYQRFNNNAEVRFPGLFRQCMSDRGHQIFNPRGQSLRTIPNVQSLLGLLLHCLDPSGSLTLSIYPTREATFFLDHWREAARNLISRNPEPASGRGLQGLVADWQQISYGRSNPIHPREWPSDWPALELIFKLITWIPDFQKDPEHQVWLEVITRTIASAGLASPYGMQLYRSGDHRDRSRQSFIRDALLPIAKNEVDVDEEILPSVPRDYLQVMTIHQSKGLEFPLVIVDVGSHFKRNHHAQAFRRYPKCLSNIVVMENDVEPYLESPLRSGRASLDRTFDDLVRLYYVAYSRPQSVLMLIGCENLLKFGKEGSVKDGAIPNVALGWNRGGEWSWRQTNYGRRRPVRVDPPLLLISD